MRFFCQNRKIMQLIMVEIQDFGKIDFGELKTNETQKSELQQYS
jgi:hypothetical protein